jgi:hypothetical protein
MDRFRLHVTHTTILWTDIHITMTKPSNATTAPLPAQGDIIDPIQRKRNFWEDIEGTFETQYEPLPDDFIGKNPATNQKVSSQHTTMCRSDGYAVFRER